ncbi:MAG: hypothetical protein J6T39_01085, partial [Clostridia bacterium]|nr:hypothetical protein [Clostridia bacterium]
RILLPYLCFAVFEVLLILFSNNFNGTNIVRILLFGGLGMGSFYTILLVQIILLFPLIFKLVQSKKYWGLLIAFLFTVIFEIVFNLVLDISNQVVYELWRNLICRQVFYLASGCFVALNKNKILNVFAYIFVFVGALNYLLLRLNIYTPVLFLTWTGTAIPFGIFAVGIVYIFANIFVFEKENKLISTFSNSTYHIFLVQQAFFYINHEIYTSTYYGVWFNIFVCCFVGILFFLVQTKVQKLRKERK